MRLGHGLARWVIGGVLAAGAVLALVGAKTPARLPLVLVFLVLVPALAVAGALGGMDLLARVVVAGSAAIVIDLLIAEAMIMTGSWSPRTGVIVVALVGLLIVAARLLAARRPRPGIAMGETADHLTDAGGPGSRTTGQDSLPS